MRKKLTLLTVFLLPVVLHAQVTLSAQLLPAGLVQKSQLWNLMLSNAGASTLQVSLAMTLRDASTGQSVLSGTTTPFALPKGVKLVTPSNVGLVQYITNTGIATGNYLPLGTYVACYTLTKQTGDAVDPLAEECIRVNISPLSPPLLITPTDKSVLNTKTPQFTWIPPTPSSMIGDWQYDFNVCEVNESQTPAEAVLYNTPVYSRGNLTANFETYSNAYAGLLPGKKYAWQVTAKSGGNYAAATEVWTFTLANDSTKAVDANDTYILLKEAGEATGISFITAEHLNIKYYSFEQEHKAVINFRSIDGKVVDTREVKVTYGDNYYSFKVGHAYQRDHIYILEITTPSGKKYKASFSIK